MNHYAALFSSSKLEDNLMRKLLFRKLTKLTSFLEKLYALRVTRQKDGILIFAKVPKFKSRSTLWVRNFKVFTVLNNETDGVSDSKKKGT